MIRLTRRYHDCAKCNLHRFRKKLVLGEGPLPADILIIGEGPGKSENMLGRPFIGPSGRILRKGLEDAGKAPSVFITNLVSCRPCDGTHDYNREPTDEEVMACWPRLQRTAQLVKPKAVVLLGKLAAHHCLRHFPEAAQLQHPSFILRRGGYNSTEYRSFVRGLEDVFKEVRGG